MRRRSPELRYALLAVVLITLTYVLAIMRRGTIPGPSGLGGHLLGVIGFILMFMTETLYSLRKRSKRAARWGRMQSWLRFHIFSGLVGPYMVLLHTSWRFNGLAGVVTLLTLIVVSSGFVGRYIYTSVPRTADGVELDSGNLGYQIAATEADMQDWLDANPKVSRVLPQNVVGLPQIPYEAWPLIFGRAFLEWGFRWQWWRAKRRLKSPPPNELKALYTLLTRRRELRYQVASLVLSRRVLALWHSVHVPLGMALFAAAFVHIGAALYFVTLAR